PDFLTEHEVAAADRVSPIREVVFQCTEHLFTQLRRDALIGDDVEDPVVLGAIDGVVLLRGGAEVFALLQADAGELMAQELDRAVRGKRIDQVNLVGPFDRAHAVFDEVTLVEGGDDGGDWYAHRESRVAHRGVRYATRNARSASFFYY